MIATLSIRGTFHDTPADADRKNATRRWLSSMALVRKYLDAAINPTRYSTPSGELPKRADCLRSARDFLNDAHAWRNAITEQPYVG